MSGLAGYSEETIGMVSKLYEARRALRVLLGDSYESAIEQWRSLVRRAMEQEKKPALSAMLVLSGLTTDPMHYLFLMAASVDIIEADNRGRL